MPSRSRPLQVEPDVALVLGRVGEGPGPAPVDAAQLEAGREVERELARAASPADLGPQPARQRGPQPPDRARSGRPGAPPGSRIARSISGSMSARLVLTSMPTGETTITSAPAGRAATIRPRAASTAGVHVARGCRRARAAASSSRLVGVELGEVPELVAGDVGGAERQPRQVEAAARASSSAAASATRAGAPSSRRRRPSISRDGVAAEHLVDRLGPAEEPLEAAVGRRRAPTTAAARPGRGAASRTPGRPAGPRPAAGSRRGRRRGCACRAAPSRSQTGGGASEVAHVADPLLGRRPLERVEEPVLGRARRRCRACAGRRRRTGWPGRRGRATCPAPRSAGERRAAGRRRAGGRAPARWRRRTGGWPASVRSRGGRWGFGGRRGGAGPGGVDDVHGREPSAAVPSARGRRSPRSRARRTRASWPAQRGRRAGRARPGRAGPARPSTSAADAVAGDHERPRPSRTSIELAVGPVGRRRASAAPAPASVRSTTARVGRAARRAADVDHVAAGDPAGPVDQVGAEVEQGVVVRR